MGISGRISQIFLHSQMTPLIALIALLLGAFAVLVTPREEEPQINVTMANVLIPFPGASAKDVESLVTTPAEQVLSRITGLEHVYSVTKPGMAVLTVQFKVGEDRTQALVRLYDTINSNRDWVSPSLGVGEPIIKPMGIDDVPIVSLTLWTADPARGAYQLERIAHAAEIELQRVPGVRTVATIGGARRALRVLLDVERLHAWRLTPQDVRMALIAANVAMPSGSLVDGNRETQIETGQFLASANEVKRLVVGAVQGRPIYLEDVAEVQDGPELPAHYVWYGNGVAGSGKGRGEFPAVTIAVAKKPGENAVDVASRLTRRVEQLKGSIIPEGVEVSLTRNYGETANDKAQKLIQKLIFATLSVVALVWLALGRREAVIVGTAVILTLAATLFASWAWGFTLNRVSLFALIFSIGILVDDAIVVVENIHRHIEHGMKPFDAAILGAREILYPIIAMTITLAAVYAPIAFVSGLTGVLFREFALTLAGAVIVSGIVAVTLSPMMCSKLLKAEDDGAKPGWLPRHLDRLFEGLKQRYQRRLHGTLNYRPVTLLVLAGVIAATGLMYMTTQKELAPEEDQGILFTLVKTPQYANLDYLEEATQQIYRVFSTLPEKDHVFAINGMGDVHQGFAGILLKPWGERERNHKSVLQDLQPKIAGIAPALALAFSPPALPGSTGGPPVQFVITTTRDFRQLSDVLADVEKSARESGMFIFSDSDLRFETPQIEFHIDHDKANRLGITMADIGTSLATLLGGNYVNLFDLYGRSYQVIPQVPREFRLNEDWLTRYQIRTSSGTLVPLSNVATVKRTVQPNSLTNFQQLNSATLSAVPFPGRTVGEAIDFLKKKAAESFPEGFSYDFQGESRQFVQEGDSLVYTFVFALIIIFLVLAAQYESFRDPLIILVALPTSMFGALIPLNAGLATINIYTQIGLVTLIGLISKHGILMVDFANKLQEEQGYGRREAIEHAAAIRLRPILMTTAAMVVAMVPLLVAKGAGAASRFDIGVVIAAGMTIGTLFTLFVTPAVYTFLARDHQKAKARAGALAAETDAHQGQVHAETLQEADEAAEAGMLFPAEAEKAPADGHLSPEARAIGSAAAAASSGPHGPERRAAKRQGRRRRFPPAAE